MQVGDKYIVEKPKALCLPHNVGDTIEIVAQESHNPSQFMSHDGYYFGESDVTQGKLTKITSDATSLYSRVGKGYYQVGESEIRWSARRKDGQRQLVIKYQDSSQTIACVKEKDIPKLAAALMEYF